MIVFSDIKEALEYFDKRIPHFDEAFYSFQSIFDSFVDYCIARCDENPYYYFLLFLAYNNRHAEYIFEQNKKQIFKIIGDKYNISSKRFVEIFDSPYRDSSLKYLKLAYEHNFDLAISNYGGLLYFSGEKNKGIEILQSGAKKDNTKCLLNLAYIEEVDNNNIPEAIKLLKKAVAKNDAEAMSVLGNIYYEKGMIEEALELLNKAEENGWHVACERLCVHFDSIGDVKNSTFYFYKCVEYNNPRYLNILGMKMVGENAMFPSISVEKNIDKGIAILENTAKSFYYSRAYYNLARIYFNGIGVPSDPYRANKYMIEAACLDPLFIDYIRPLYLQVGNVGNHAGEPATFKNRFNS